MIDLSTLPEPEFVEVNWENLLNELKGEYEKIADVTLTRGQVEHILLATFTYGGNLLRTNMNDTGKQCLLAFAEKEKLDHIGALVGVERLPAQKALTTLRFTFEEPLAAPLTIPAGSRAMSGDDVAIFETIEAVTAEIGDTYIDVSAQCTEAGTVGSSYQAGEINQLVDPIAYVESVENTTLTFGGADEESDDHYRQAIQEAPEGYSTAGPEGAYEYWAKRVHQDIVDVSLDSRGVGQIYITVLMKDGESPSQEILDLLVEEMNGKKRRPMSEEVFALAPETVEYTIDVDLYLYKEFSSLSSVILADANTKITAYAAEKREKLDLDIVPEQISGILQQIAGVFRAKVNSPVYTELQSNQVAKCISINIVVKGTV